MLASVFLMGVFTKVRVGWSSVFGEMYDRMYWKSRCRAEAGELRAQNAERIFTL